MADALYNKFKEKLLQAGLDLTALDIRMMLVKDTYVFSAAHEFLSDLGAVDNGRTGSLTAKTITNGVFDADNTTVTATSAVSSNAIVMFVHTGADATARVIAYIDFGAFTPSAGMSLGLAPDPAGIFSL